MNARKNIYPEVLRRLERQEPFVLATIVEAEGATPQVPGASALFGGRGLLLGTLGGGMLEADAEKRAQLCLKNRSSLCYRFELQGEDLAGGEPICGGFVRILVDGSPDKERETWRRLADALLARRNGVLVTQIDLRPDDQAEIKRLWFDEQAPNPEAGSTLQRFTRELARVSRQGKPVLLQEQDMVIQNHQALHFLEPVAPLPRLLIVGAGHIGQAVARQAEWLDFEVTVIDDRREFAHRRNLPDADRVIRADFGKALGTLPFTEDTYIVIATPGHEHDAEALRACVRSNADYIGLVGSRTKIALMREEFLAKRWATARQFDRVHAPVGLPIGSKTVQEIAVSIAAELARERRRNMGKKCRRK